MCILDDVGWAAIILVVLFAIWYLYNFPPEDKK